MIEEYYIKGKDLYDMFVDKGINNLYHANTLATSQTFIEQNALLSRNFIDENELFQTQQESDEKDKIYDVWDSFFLDGKNLADYYKRNNNYGPIIFVVKLDVLLIENIKILVTRNNPYYWQTNNHAMNYFKDITEVSKMYLETDYRYHARIMFLIRSPDKLITLTDYVEKIIFYKTTSKEINYYVKSNIELFLINNNLNNIRFEMNNDPKIMNTYSNLDKEKKNKFFLNRNDFMEQV